MTFIRRTFRRLKARLFVSRETSDAEMAAFITRRLMVLEPFERQECLLQLRERNDALYRLVTANFRRMRSTAQ